MESMKNKPKFDTFEVLYIVQSDIKDIIIEVIWHP